MEQRRSKTPGVRKVAEERVSDAANPRQRRASSRVWCIREASARLGNDTAAQVALLVELADVLTQGAVVSSPLTLPEETTRRPSGAAVFCREGEYWESAYLGKSIQLKRQVEHRVGFDEIVHCFSNPAGTSRCSSS